MLKPKQEHTGTPRNILSVSELNSQARRLLEVTFSSIWVEGEISNLARPASGHWYFTLKDAGAQVRSAMFRNRNQALRFAVKEGMQVRVRARVSLYEGRGDYQLIVENMEPAGAGALQQAFEQLKARLAAEGLFAPERKQPLPQMPKHIGIVTSPTGAAIRDFLTVLERRFPSTRVTIIPTLVQGNEAAPQIVRAIQLAQQLPDLDVLVLSRGGGSLEDLWPFNDEYVARTIAACPIPTVSAVGHEIDFSISDFVADYRAPTPSAAAEVLSHDQADWHNTLEAWRQQLAMTMNRLLGNQRQALQHLHKRLRHPGYKLQEQSQRLDDLEVRLQQAIKHQLLNKKSQLGNIQSRLHQNSPLNQLKAKRIPLTNLHARLDAAIKQLLELHRHRLSENVGRMNAYSPLATLGRGYSILQKEDGQVVRQQSDVSKDEIITARLGKGQLSCRVEDVITDS
ncbi:exodeoxyribonuclease VII large subunit [Spongorhabdus nitratireducens]